ncbi:MAG TPA: cytochrome c-type biogenesis protein [Gaiellaceae bacterium]
MKAVVLALGLALALMLAAPAVAGDRHPSQAKLEGEVMCPVCHTTLDQSDSPVARHMKAFIGRRIRAGDSESEIKAKLVASFGPAVLAEPPRHGFALLAWLLPIGGIALGALALGFAAWRWSRAREPSPALAGGLVLDPELDRRLDDELRRFE